MADDGFVIDGKKYTVDDLTFKEQREMRRLARELVDDPKAAVDEMALVDVLPALITVVVRRDKPEFTLEDADNMRMSDVVPDEDDVEPGPTVAASDETKKSTRGTSGTRS